MDLETTYATPPPSNAVELVATERGIVVSGEPDEVEAVIAQLLERSEEAGTSVRRLALDGFQIGANLFAVANTHREYVELSERSRQLILQHGAQKGKGDGFFRMFVMKDGKFAGNMEWRPVNLGPEQAMSVQILAGQMAIRAAIKEVTEALERIEGKIDHLARLAKAERLGAVIGDRSTLQPLVARARATSVISVTDWATVASLGPLIARDIASLRAYVLHELADVERSALVRNRAAQAADLADDMIKEFIALLVVAEQNYMMWQDLRLAHAANHEATALDAVADDIHDQLNAVERADQQLVNKLHEVIEVLTAPTGYEGLAPLKKQQLRAHATEVDSVMRWFAEQRHLDTDPTAVQEFAGFSESANKVRGIIAAGTKRFGKTVADTSEQALSRVKRRRADGQSDDVPELES